jgi:hypothetical protein
MLLKLTEPSIPRKGHGRWTFQTLTLSAIEVCQARHENNPMTREYADARQTTCGPFRMSRFFVLIAFTSLCGCDGAPSRNILGSYFPSWMVCALLGMAVAGIARGILRSTGILQELPVPFVVILAIGCAATFTLWLLWLA